MTEAGKGKTKIEIDTLVEVMDAEEETGEVIIVTNREEGLVVARAVLEGIEMTDEHQVCSSQTGIVSGIKYYISRPSSPRPRLQERRRPKA